jgi:alpha-glucosidase
LSPIYPSPLADLGYDITDYQNVEPKFGSLHDFDEMVSEAHRRDLKIILDWVPNHTSDEHPWFLDSRSNRQSAKRQWYLWRDAKPDGTPPNNWISVFGGSVWQWDSPTEQFYLHTFLEKQPDLNWRNPDVTSAMFDTMRFWLKRGVDGFRIDALDLLIKDDQFRDNLRLPQIALRKQRTNRTIDQARSERFLFTRTSLSLEEATRNLPGRVGLFLVVNG